METRTELLNQKLALLEDLLRETERQRDLIAAVDAEGLCESLAARQNAMNAIDGLDGRITALPAGPGGPADEIRGLLERILRLDEENRRNAAGMAEGLTSGFREVGAQRSMMAYTRAADQGSKFIDREG